MPVYNCRYSFSSIDSTHTHTFNGPFSGTTRVGQYQKGKTNLDFTEARESDWQWHQLCIITNHHPTRPINVHPVVKGGALQHCRLTSHYIHATTLKTSDHCHVYFRLMILNSSFNSSATSERFLALFSHVCLL